MVFKSIFHNETSENTFLVFDEETKNGIIIDPGCKMEKIDNLIAENGVNVKYILLTHCHYDHIKGVEKLREITGAELCVTEECAGNIKNPNVNLSGAWLDYKIVHENPEITLNENEVFNFEGIEVKTIKTPGHTNCSTCFIFGNDLFSGDTLFLQTTGRWDLPTGDEDTLRKSIKEKLYTLDDDINVYPGHGKKTSIGYEKNFNFLVRG